MNCKHCGGNRYIKNGFLRGKQSYLCKECGKRFTEGDLRKKGSQGGKALAILPYSCGKSSVRFLARPLNFSPTTICRWLSDEAERLLEIRGTEDVFEMELDEMWHFLNKKKTNYGLGVFIYTEIVYDS